MLKKIGLLSLLSFVSVNAFADTLNKTKVEAQFAKLFGEKPAITEITPTPIPNLYEVTIGAEVFYITKDENYILYGHLIDVKGEKPKSLTEEKTNEIRAKLINAFDTKNMLIFKPKGPVKHTITVFTDIDCGYCRQFHKEVPSLNAKGVEVRYIFFPRTGLGSPSFKKAVAVLCSANPQEAYTKATLDEEIPSKQNCTDAENIVKADLQLVDKLGVRATPVIILNNGEMIPGYVPEKALMERLEQKK